MKFKELLTEREKNPNYTKQIAAIQKMGFQPDPDMGIGSYITNLFKDDLMVSIESQSSPDEVISLGVPLSNKLTKLIPAAKRGRYEDTSIFFASIAELKKFLAGKKSKFKAY